MLTPAESEDASADAEPVASFQMAAQDFTAAYNDAKALLGDFYSTNGNPSGYDSDAFDILMKSAAAAVSPEARDAYLHDAEAILLNDAPVIPICYEGLSWQLREGLSGLYRAPTAYSSSIISPRVRRQPDPHLQYKKAPDTISVSGAFSLFSFTGTAGG